MNARTTRLGAKAGSSSRRCRASRRPGSFAAWGLVAFLATPAAHGQGSVTPFGSGCGPTGGPSVAFQGAPAPGAPVTVTISGFPQGAAVYLLVGFSNTTSAFGSLPLSLPTPPFSGGCFLLTSADVIAKLPVVASNASIGGLLASNPSDYHLYLQALSLGPDQTPSQMSAALDVHVVAPGQSTTDVNGTVTHLASGAPAADARVTLFRPDLTFFAERRTDATGAYAFTNVEAGTYRLGVAKLAFDYQEVTLILTSGSLTQDFALSPESHLGQWAIIGNTLPELFDATDMAAYRPDGTIFFCHNTRDPILFDPVAGTKFVGADSGSAQGCMNSTLLATGDVLICGGQDGDNPGDFTKAIPWVKRFSSANLWVTTPWMLAPTGRWYPGLARLADGRVLVFGGGTAPNAARTDTAEVFDPTTLTWTWTGKMGSTNEFAPAGLLYTGNVLRTWGTNPEIYDPQTGQWTPTGSFSFPNRGYPGHSDHSMLVLTDGRALVLGVLATGDPNAPMSEFYDPSTGAWTAGTSPDLKRYQGEVVYLPDGRVLYGGGDQGTTSGSEPNVLGIVKRCDLFDPNGQTWRRVADALTFREYHGVTLLLPDGRVSTTGGTHIKFQSGPTSADIEAYSPPYLFRGVRPQIANPSTLTPTRGQTFSFQYFPATVLTNVVLMGVQSTTHWVDGGIPRRLELPFSQNSGVAQVTLPPDPNLLPVGWYMLFAMVDDVPSKALVLRVDP